MKVIRDYPQQGVPADVQGTAKMALDILFLNSAVDATGDPLNLLTRDCVKLIQPLRVNNCCNLLALYLHHAMLSVLHDIYYPQCPT